MFSQFVLAIYFAHPAIIFFLNIDGYLDKSLLHFIQLLALSDLWTKYLVLQQHFSFTIVMTVCRQEHIYNKKH